MPRSNATSATQAHGLVDAPRAAVEVGEMLTERVSVYRPCVDVCRDPVLGCVLSHLVYWHLPDAEGRTRLRVSRDGHYWVARRRPEWMDACGLTPRQADRALARLRDLGLIETRVFRFDGSPTTHIRVHMEELCRRLREPGQDADQGSSIVTDRGDGIHRNGEMEMPESVKTTTETTAGTTTETTTTIVAEALEPADVVASLCVVGVTRTVAEWLCAEHPAEAIRAQISALPHRAARDPAAVLVQAIRDGWALPAAHLAAEAEASRHAEERMRRQSARDLGRRRDEEEAARSAQLNAAFAALPRDQRDAIEEQAKNAVRRKMAAAWGGRDRDWTVGINRAMLETARREIVAGRRPP